MKKIGFLICLWSLAGILTTEIHAQLWGPQAGGVIYKISPNGRYVTGMTQASNGNGFVWDTQSNVFETLGQAVYPHGITDDRMIAANNRYREPDASEWNTLGDGVWLWQVTPDGQTVAGHLADATGATAPYSWSRNATGGWTAKGWTHPDSIRQGAIYDISGDGQTAVGYVHISNRVAILWRSPDSAYELPFSTGAYSEYF
ncbi:MAG: hypothetical protein LBR97_05760, partial [Dysgonamonadaceae bacterium]|nr:hypothetical protein [Dysgonamonadaceae bacterium]